MNNSTSIDRTREALNHIPADDRGTWLNMAMALKSEHGESAFDMFDDWSQQSESYQPRDTRAVWKSVHADGGITIGTQPRPTAGGITAPIRSPLPRSWPSATACPRSARRRKRPPPRRGARPPHRMRRPYGHPRPQSWPIIPTWCARAWPPWTPCGRSNPRERRRSWDRRYSRVASD